VPRAQPRQVLCKLQQFSVSASQPSVGTAACDACENTRDDINFPVDFCNPDFPWWYKQEETTLGTLRTSSWKVSSGSTDK